MSKTKIEWTDETWPVVTGCAPVSTGCTHCYAARMAATRLKHHPRYEGLATIENGKVRWTGEVRLNHDMLEQPLRWRKPRRVFVASMGDLFHKDVPLDFIRQVFNIMADTRQHTFQVLTKRPERMSPFFETRWLPFPVLSNVWLGVSIENQAAADERREYLKQCPAAVKFVSYEPALSPVDWTGWEFVSQIISGGESGPGARPSHPDWHRATRDFCQTNEIAYFFKQWGAWIPYSKDDHENKAANWQSQTNWDLVRHDRLRFMHVSGICEPFYKETVAMIRIGKKAAGHLLDGRTWDEMPACVAADRPKEVTCF